QTYQNMNSGSNMNWMNWPLFRRGFVIWLAATLALRFVGQYILKPGGRGWPVLLPLSIPLMALVVLAMCRSLRNEQRPAGALSIMLPTLLLDPLSCIYFRDVFPNMAPEMAGIFGAWMLYCCAGAAVGGLLRR